MEVEMELVDYDEETKEYTVRFKQDEFLDIMDVMSGVYSTSSLQDFTALGATKERVHTLSRDLYSMLPSVKQKEIKLR
jgi:hypothetical protein